ncbi:MAG: phospho-sugar mutase [Ornithinimicrobium sp.]
METPQDLLTQARDWREDDPDETTRQELADLIGRVEADGTPDADRASEDVQDALAELADRFSGTLTFGTAGLRGPLGAGPNRMNRSVVIRAAAGLTAYLQDEGGIASPLVVIGFDARTNSEVFATDTAAVVVAAGGRAMILPTPLPTPVLAFAIGHLDADAGVMVTASHNPATDNGYKVYLGDGSQIVSPADTQIAAHIDAVQSTSAVSRAEQDWTRLGDEVLEAYLDAVAAVVDPDSPRELSLVHTALHGVGGEVVRRAFERVGFDAPAPVEEQEQPDPAFSTVTFPNPEEAGAMDAALLLAEAVHPDAVIANDPDADRCAVAVPGKEGWRMLRGDEVGWLLGHHLIARGIDPAGERSVLARSIVSSRLLGSMADAAGLPAVETLTGFKWIGRVSGLAYGYEEALGYCCDPATVPDKDGISAALLMAELIAKLRSKDRTVQDVLDELALGHGVHATESFSVRLDDLSAVPPMLRALLDSPPERIGEAAVRSVEDLEQGSGDLPGTPGVRFYLEDDTRIIVRPSGTEPKIKVYIEAIVPVAGRGQLTASRAQAQDRLNAVVTTMEKLTAAS